MLACNQGAQLLIYNANYQARLVAINRTVDNRPHLFLHTSDKLDTSL